MGAARKWVEKYFYFFSTFYKNLLFCAVFYKTACCVVSLYLMLWCNKTFWFEYIQVFIIFLKTDTLRIEKTIFPFPFKLNGIWSWWQFSFRFWTKWNSIWFKIERKKTIPTIISHSMWKEIEHEFSQCTRLQVLQPFCLPRSRRLSVSYRSPLNSPVHHCNKLPSGLRVRPRMESQYTERNEFHALPIKNEKNSSNYGNFIPKVITRGLFFNDAF